MLHAGSIAPSSACVRGVLLCCCACLAVTQYFWTTRNIPVFLNFTGRALSRAQVTPSVLLVIDCIRSDTLAPLIVPLTSCCMSVLRVITAQPAHVALQAVATNLCARMYPCTPTCAHAVVQVFGHAWHTRGGMLQGGKIQHLPTTTVCAPKYSQRSSIQGASKPPYSTLYRLFLWKGLTPIVLYRLGQYSKDEAASFQLMPEMSFFPGFMFHLRRSQFVQVFGNSPDETAFARLTLMKEPTQHCMLMIQPQLDAYSIDSWEEGIVSRQPTVLDVQSINPGSVLFLDTYFYVVVYHGNDIARWRQEGYAFTLYVVLFYFLFSPRILCPQILDYEWCRQNSLQQSMALSCMLLCSPLSVGSLHSPVDELHRSCNATGEIHPNSASPACFLVRCQKSC